MDRRHPLVAMVVVLLASALASAGCSEEARYKVRLTPDSALDGAGGIDLVLLRVTCAQVLEAGGIADGWWVVTRSQWRGGQPPVDIGEVRPGRYALLALVRGADCSVSWAQCVDGVELERGGGGTIDVQLQQIGGAGCLPGEICDGQGLCVPAPECDNVTVACDGDGDGHLFCLEGQSPPDCDCRDDDGSIFPGAEEHCDGTDNDCNGENDPPECSGCFDRCAEPDVCQHPSCPDGPAGDCFLEHDDDGTDCDGDAGSLVCCAGACEGACTPGDTQPRGCGQCGIQERECGADCQWGAYGTCNESGVSECAAGATRTVPCGNCGTQDEVCSAQCAWEPDGACAGQGVCAAGTDAAVACGNCGQRIDTCADDCTWTTASCEPDPDLVASCTDPDVCCPNGSCGEQGAECCGTDTSTCGAEARCMNWTCVAGICTAVDETTGEDPESECAGADCCDGNGACTSAGCA